MCLEPIEIHEALGVGASTCSRSCDASYIDRLIDETVVGNQIEPARASWDDVPGKAARTNNIESQPFANLLKTPYGTQERVEGPRSVSGAPRGVPGTLPEHPDDP